MDRRLLVIAIALLLAALVAPTPTHFARVAGDDVPAAMPRLLVARGPAEARFEPENAGTLLIFRCGHFDCRVAARVEGDATRLADDAHALLLARDAPHRRAPLDAPLGDPRAFPPGVEPTVIEPAFRALPFWPLALATPALVVVAIANAGASWGGRSGAARAGVAAAVGVAIAIVGLRALGGDAVLWLYLLAALVTAQALMALAFFRGRRWPWTLAALALALDLVVWRSQAWFPSAPSL